MPQDNSIPLQPFQGESPVDNYLQSYYQAKQQKRADLQSAQQDKIGQQTLQLNDMKLAEAKHNNLVNILGRSTDEASFQNGLRQATLPVEQGGLGLSPEQVSGLSFAKDYKRLQEEAGVIKEQLGNDLLRAQIDGSRANTALTNAQANAVRAKPVGVQTKAPQGYQYVIGEDGQPSLQIIPGGPADPANKPLTDEQAKALGFANRVKDANALLENPDVIRASTSYSSNSLASVPIIGNSLVSEDYQQSDQARRDFINAVLRRESGAAISSGEFENANKQYLPQPGDSEKVIQRKAFARQRALQNLLLSAGPQSKSAAEAAAPQQSVGQPNAQYQAPSIPPLPPGFRLR